MDSSGALTRSYDAATGQPLWTVLEPPTRRGDGANAIGVAPDGSRVYVTGERIRDYRTSAIET